MKKCEATVKLVNSFKTRLCRKKAILYLKNLETIPFGKKELYLCPEHANRILRTLTKIK